MAKTVNAAHTVGTNTETANAEYAVGVDPRMYLKFSEGWTAHIKQTWEKGYCYGKFPGEDYYHLLLKGEIFVQRDDEKFCLACAVRLGHLTFDRLFWQRDGERTL